MKKKSVSMIIVFILLLSMVTACASGSKKTGTEVTTAATAAATAAATPAATPEPPYELKVSVAGTDVPGFEELAKAFESQNPGAKVTVTRIKDGGQYQTLLQTQLATRDAPNIFFLWPGLNVRDTFVKGNYVEDLSGLSIVSKINDGLKAPYTYDGKTYAVPYTYYFLGLFYNKDVFAKAGVKVPTNWQEYTQAADALKKADVTPLALPGKDNLGWLWYMSSPSLVYAKEPDWDAKRFQNTVKFADSPGWQAAAAKIKELNDKQYIQADSLGTTYDQTRAMVMSGKAGMYIDGNWALSQIKEAATKANVNIGAFIFPFNNPGEPIRGAASPSNGPAIWSESKHKDAAKKLLEFIFSDENAQKLIGDGNISTNKNVKSTPDPIIADIIAQNNKEGTYQFIDGGYPAGDWGPVFASGTQQSIGGKADFEKTLKDLDAAWDRNVQNAAKK